MWPRNMIRVGVPLSLLMFLGAVPGQGGWAGLRFALSQAVVEPAPAASGPSARPADEEAIRAADASFVRDYNRGDGKALAAMFTEDAEVVEGDGVRYQGRESIERSFADTFAANPGAQITLDVDAIRFLAPDVAKEEGRSVVTPAQGAPVASFYTVLFVRRDGRWLISSAREDADPRVRPGDRLKDLGWMVGEWLDEGPDAVSRFDCRWSEDGNFLIRSFSLKREGKSVMSGTQRIGWDPLARQFRSWEFDSEGGYGEGRWSRDGDGDRWVVKHSDVRPDGTTTSATNVMTRVRPDMVRWASTDRVVGDESIPGEDAFVLVRVPPAPRPGPDAGASPSTSPNTERSPK